MDFIKKCLKEGNGTIRFIIIAIIIVIIGGPKILSEISKEDYKYNDACKKQVIEWQKGGN